MPIIPLRVLTTLVGLILGYTAGIYVEILYNVRSNHMESVESFITGFRAGLHYSDGGYSEDDNGDIDSLCRDCCDSATSSDESDID